MGACFLAQGMNVIFDSADGDGVAFQVLQNARLVSPHAVADVAAQPRMPALRGEDEVRAEDMQ
jgi:hypothetical protein